MWTGRHLGPMAAQSAPFVLTPQRNKHACFLDAAETQPARPRTSSAACGPSETRKPGTPCSKFVKNVKMAKHSTGPKGKCHDAEGASGKEG